MMNKTKTTKSQVGRFLLLLPMVAIILLSFRKSFIDQPDVSIADQATVLTDTIPDATITNSKGYYIDIKDDMGNCTVVIKDKGKKEVKRVLLTEWNANESRYENLYGEIPHPFLKDIEKSIKSPNPDVRTVTVKNNIATVILNNGKKEVFTLSLSPEKKAFENKYCLPNSTLITTESLQKVQVEGEVESVGEIREEAIKEVRIANTIETELAEEAITVAGVKSAIKTGTTNTTTKPELATVTITGAKNVEGVTANVIAESPLNLKEFVIAKVDFINIGGLTMEDEKQYILLDGKEYKPQPAENLKGTYRITFIDKKDAEKKYGVKGKNGAIILETIK